MCMARSPIWWFVTTGRLGLRSFLPWIESSLLRKTVNSSWIVLWPEVHRRHNSAARS